MRYFPAFIDIDQALVLVVGGGEAAAQKVRLLRKTSARIEIVASRLTRELASLSSDGSIEWIQDEFRIQYLKNPRLVFAAQEDKLSNARVAFAARAKSIPVNVVDQPQLCTFITPAIVDRDPVLVSIGTEGAAPVLAQKIKAKIEQFLPVQLGSFARFAQSLRPRLAAVEPDARERRIYWRHFFEGSVASHFFAGRRNHAKEIALHSMNSRSRTPGSLSIIGMGNGDPELLPVKAVRLLGEADIVGFERHIHPAILENLRREAKRLVYEKASGHDAIDEALIREAGAGNRVVRLQQGHPELDGDVDAFLIAARAAGIEAGIVPAVNPGFSRSQAHGFSLSDAAMLKSRRIRESSFNPIVDKVA